MIIESLWGKIKNAVSVAERVTGKNLSLPILSSLVLEAKDNNLKIKATNLDLGLEFFLPCKVGQSGAVAVNGSLLSNFFNSLPPGSEKIKLETRDGNLSLVSEHYQTAIKVYPIDDFPTIPHLNKPDGSFSVSPIALVAALKSVWYSASSSSLKPEIASVCFYQHQDDLSLVATDSFRLAERRLEVMPARIKCDQLIVPLKNVVEIMKILERVETDLEVKYNQHQISFLADNFYLTSRLVDGIFPDYRQIIPTHPTTRLVIGKRELLDGLKLANVFSDKLNQANLSFRSEEDRVEVETRNDNGQNRVWLKPLSSTGGDVSVSLNLRYLLEGLQAVVGESVILSFSGEAKPVMLQDGGDEAFVYLVMPIRR